MKTKQPKKMRGFWAPGFWSHQGELAKEEQAALDPLNTALEAAADIEQRVALKKQIVSVKKKFKQRRKSASLSLYDKK